MKEPTRATFMESLKSIKGFEPLLMLPGVVVDTTTGTSPALSGLTLVEYNGTGYGPIS